MDDYHLRAILNDKTSPYVRSAGNTGRIRDRPLLSYDIPLRRVVPEGGIVAAHRYHKHDNRDRAHVFELSSGCGIQWVEWCTWEGWVAVAIYY